MTQMNMMTADNYKYSDITEKIIETFKILFNHNNQRHQRSIFDC
jgi:hypothetical protein